MELCLGRDNGVETPGADKKGSCSNKKREAIKRMGTVTFRHEHQKIGTLAAVVV